MSNLGSLIDSYYKSSGDIIVSCHQALQQLYPELMMRWARIYGYRWSFIHGTIIDNISTSLVKLRLNNDYGLCIDNANIITPEQLNEIKNTLKEYFANDKFFHNPDS